MRVETMFPSKWLSSADLPPGRDVAVMIQEIEVVDVGGGGADSECKPAIRFAGKTKRLLLNRENAGRIARMYGPETDNWIGRQIVLFVDQTTFKGRPVDAVRVKVILPSPMGGGAGEFGGAAAAGPAEPSTSPTNEVAF